MHREDQTSETGNPDPRQAPLVIEDEALDAVSGGEAVKVTTQAEKRLQEHRDALKGNLAG